MKLLVYKRPHDGGVAILTVTPEFIAKNVGLTEDEILDLIQAEDISPTIPTDGIKRMQAAQLPGFAEFRNAWDLVGNTVLIDMPKAKVIHQTKISRIKDREMKILVDDIVIGQALAQDVTGLQSQVQDIQTAVDNVSQNINAAGTPAILKAVWPVGLPTE